MNRPYWQSKLFKTTGLLIALGLGVRACATSEFSWREEVLLHDGRKIIVEREEIYDGGLRHEIGQNAPLAEQIIRFKNPDTNQPVTWKSSNRSPEHPENLDVLSLDFLSGIPYLATTTSYCLAYNSWGRPDPPYIFFKYIDGWKRIPVEEFPEQFKINLIYGTNTQIEQKIAAERKKHGFLSAEIVADINKESGRSKQFYSIIRLPLKEENPGAGCPDYSSKQYRSPKAPSN